MYFLQMLTEKKDPQNRKTLQGLNFHELLYADNTLVVAKSTKTAKTYLKLIEDESEYYHMKLNKDKCTYIAFNKNNKIIFRDGTPFESVDKTTYLGTEIAKRVDPGLEISRRISLTMPVLKNLTFFANKRTYQRNGNYKSSSQYASPNFYIVSKRYNLLKQRRQSWTIFELKGQRKILNMETTYIKRANTNEEVYRRANAEARTDRENTIRPLSQVLEEKRIKLLGHIIRRPREHPQHQTTFYTRSLIPRTVDRRRVGRPRLSWTHETMKVAWNLSQGYPFNFQDREMRLTLQEMAQNRIPPFD